MGFSLNIPKDTNLAARAAPPSTPYLDSIKASSPELYKKITGLSAYSANEAFGGQAQDFQAQLFTPLQQSALKDVPKSITPQYDTSEDGTRTGQAQNIPAGKINGINVNANYDSSGNLTGFSSGSDATTWLDGSHYITGQWDASGNPSPAQHATKSGGFIQNTLGDAVGGLSDLLGPDLAKAVLLAGGAYMGMGGLDSLASSSALDAAGADMVTGGMAGVVPSAGTAATAASLGDLGNAVQATIQEQIPEASLSQTAASPVTQGAAAPAAASTNTLGNLGTGTYGTTGTAPGLEFVSQGGLNPAATVGQITDASLPGATLSAGQVAGTGAAGAGLLGAATTATGELVPATTNYAAGTAGAATAGVDGSLAGTGVADTAAGSTLANAAGSAAAGAANAGAGTTANQFPWAQGLLGLYDMYNKQNASKALQDQFDKVNTQINGMYAPGSPEANLMQQEMERKDAAAGRNSQYGVRAVDLASKIAATKGQLLSNTLGAQNNLLGASLATGNSSIGSLANLFGQTTGSTAANTVGNATGKAVNSAIGSGVNSAIDWGKTTLSDLFGSLGG